jgi:nitrogen fixation/metabolism regulation signal transduction histidine kinase
VVVIPDFRKLETRLVGSFLLLAAVPSLLLTLLASGRMSGVLDHLQNPGVEASLTNSARLSQALVERLRRDAEPLLSQLAGLESAEIERRLADAGFDFALRPDGPAGTLLVVRRGVSPPDAEAGLPGESEWRDLGAGRVPAVAAGRALRFFTPPRGDPSAGGPAAVGLWVPGELAQAVSGAEEDLGRYLRLRYFVATKKTLVWIFWATVFLLTAGVALLLARMTARRISRPVQELARAADRLAAGDLAHRARIEADGEIGDLVIAFNRMSAQLERSREELLRAERLAAWREVARRLAHEIRNPLTPIRLAIHRLEGRCSEDEAAQDCLRSIAEEVEGLAAISQAFSDFARLPRARFAAADLADVARSVVELHRQSKPSVEVAFAGPESLPLNADRDQLRRAITNLVKNAVEAVSGGGKVLVRVRREGTEAVLAVWDDGPGVPEEIRELLFRPGVTTKPGGSGLGLALVQQIAKDHGGSVLLERESGGTCFVLRIPLNLPEES